ncbi:hypothetical protein B0H17DRAFT_1103052 [Mycena rosella]|uniref:Uncharacterized protein n=1 Tax=Mycena rosella TaxID=1033263 RepID=A0AAD7G0X9_MYCRO|nr:hypothetical protein B0H17DRAFT_1103052 [Mycena rosella]
MPKASPSTRSRRPGPLQDLPLDLFLPPNPNLPQRPNKRVHSPGGPSLFSPTKRRILAEEGILPASLKSLPRFRVVPVFRDGSGDSPVRKLDLGLPKNSPASARAPPSAPTSAFEPHPTRLTRPGLSHTTSDAFIPFTPTSPLRRDDAQEMADYFSLPSNPTPSHLPRVQTPREIPPPVDPQSIHYPGFHVFQDAYLVTGPVLDLDMDSPLSSQKDALKENVPLRRKPRKSVTAPVSSDLKARLASPDMRVAKANSTPCTPGRSSLALERSNSTTPTARRPEVVLTRDTRLTPKLQDAERRELRRRLAEEVDDIPSDDEDL